MEGFLNFLPDAQYGKVYSLGNLMLVDNQQCEVNLGGYWIKGKIMWDAHQKEWFFSADLDRSTCGLTWGMKMRII